MKTAKSSTVCSISLLLTLPNGGFIVLHTNLKLTSIFNDGTGGESFRWRFFRSRFIPNSVSVDPKPSHVQFSYGILPGHPDFLEIRFL